MDSLKKTEISICGISDLAGFSRVVSYKVPSEGCVIKTGI